VNKNILFKRACLAAAVSMAPVTGAMADVTISGWLNEGLHYYDDGQQSAVTQSSDNGTTLGSRLTFSAKTDNLPSGLSAGMEVIIEPESLLQPLITSGQAGTAVTQSFLTDPAFAAGGGAYKYNNAHAMRVLGNSIWLAGAFGKMTIGRLSPAADNIAVLDDPSLTLWSTISPVFRGNGFVIRGTTGTALNAWGGFMSCMGTRNGLSGVGGIGIDCGDGDYAQGVRYDLPTFIPNLSLAASWVNGDTTDISGKFHTDLGRLKWSISAGYSYNAQGGAFLSPGITGGGQGSDTFQVQSGLMDPMTGLFGSIAYQHEDTSTDAAVEAAANAMGGKISDNTDAWWFKGGIKKKWNSLGDTAISFNYGEMYDQYGAGDAVVNGVNGSTVHRYGGELDQYIGSALIIYANYQVLDLSVDQSTLGLGNGSYQNADNLDWFTLGFTYFF
jgi:hypothetical protein